MEDIINQVLNQLETLSIEVNVAKNLVNGKPIDADRKLQGIQTRIIKLAESLVEKKNELASKDAETQSKGT